MITDEINNFEDRIEEMALDVGIAIDNLSARGDMDLLYMTSVAFLLVITVAIVSAIASYKQRKCSLSLFNLICVILEPSMHLCLTPVSNFSLLSVNSVEVAHKRREQALNGLIAAWKAGPEATCRRCQ